ncbi:MAG: M50 family metallopeptidase [Holophaga sp.]|nr:M50 family metallopeptidase [Holophaga sp.]
MKRLLYIAPALLASQFIPGAGFWGPIVLLVGLIFFHELGHFLVAKWMGMPVDVFSLGFGTRIAGFSWKETDVRLSLLPLGGYVRLAGYNPEEPEAQDPNGFLAQPAWKRLFFYSGGILANILITVVLFFGLGVDQARITSQRPAPSPLQIIEVTPGSAAAEAGLQSGDQIHSFGELSFPGNKSEDAITYIQSRPGTPIPVTLERDGATRTLQVVPKNEGGRGKLGVYFEVSNWIYDRRPVQFKDLGKGAQFGVVASAKLGWEIFGNFGKLITHKVSFKEVGGPITIVRAGSRAAKAGLAQFLLLTALISMNLAVLNALPIPFLDGGHAAILIVERIRGKDLSILVKERILQGGFFFLASLMAMVIALDILKLRN